MYEVMKGRETHPQRSKSFILIRLPGLESQTTIGKKV